MSQYSKLKKATSKPDGTKVWRIRGKSNPFRYSNNNHNNEYKTFYKSQPVFIFIKKSLKWHKGEIKEIVYDETIDEQYKLKIKYWTNNDNTKDIVIHTNHKQIRFIDNNHMMYHYNKNSVYNTAEKIEDATLFSKINCDKFIEYYHDEDEQWKEAKIINVELNDNNEMTMSLELKHKLNDTRAHNKQQLTGITTMNSSDSTSRIRRRYPIFLNITDSDNIENKEDIMPHCLCGCDLVSPQLSGIAYTDYYIFAHLNLSANAVSCSNCGVLFKEKDMVWSCCQNNMTSNAFCVYNLCKSCSIFFNKQNGDLLGVLHDVYICKLMEMIMPNKNNRRNNAAIFGVKEWNKCRLINKNWNNALNANYLFPNLQWKKFCLMDFPNMRFYINKMKIKRWDRYYKYKKTQINKIRKIHSINVRDVYNSQSDEDKEEEETSLSWRRYRRSRHGDTEITAQEYGKYGLIENCQYDNDKTQSKDENINGLPTGFKWDFKWDFEFDEVNINGLPTGFKWDFKCPITFDQLSKIDNTTFWCDKCKKNVYKVNSTKELAAKVKENECVTYTVLRKASPPTFYTGGIGVWNSIDNRRANAFEPY